MQNIRLKERAALLVPLLMLISMIPAFQFFVQILRVKSGYFVSFFSYWLFWCLAVPFWILDKERIRSLFAFNLSVFSEHKITNVFCLTMPLVLGYSYAFPKAIPNATPVIVLLSFLLALVNATAEEILWRGVYIKLFPEKKLISIFYSSLGFAIWHLAPLTIFPNKAPGGEYSFIATAFIVGLLYAITARNTRSIAFTILSHVLFDFSGLGARVYF
jgi:membrane protease YdiL (CAAX protease family)